MNPHRRKRPEPIPAPQPRDPLAVRIPVMMPIEQADRILEAYSMAPEMPPPLGTFLAQLTRRELAILRQATLRAHRMAVGLREIPPTIRELDEMIEAVGPRAAENLIRQAVDGRRGEAGPTGTANDQAFIDRAIKT